MRPPVGRTVVELVPVRLQVSLASRVNYKLGQALGTREPLAHNLTGTILVQDKGSDMFNGSWLGVPSRSAVDQAGIDAGDVDGKGGIAFEVDGRVLVGVCVEVEVDVAEGVAVVGHVEVDGCPLLVFGLALVVLLMCVRDGEKERLLCTL